MHMIISWKFLTEHGLEKYLFTEACFTRPFSCSLSAVLPARPRADMIDYCTVSVAVSARELSAPARLFDVAGKLQIKNYCRAMKAPAGVIRK